MQELRDLFIVGTGGLAAEAFWAASAMNQSSTSPVKWNILGFFDAHHKDKDPIFIGLRVFTSIDQMRQRIDKGTPLYFSCAIGDNQLRRKVALELEQEGLQPARIIHPSTIFGTDAKVGVGSLVAAGVIFAPFSVVGRYAVINVQSTIGHQSKLGDFVHICPGVRIGGTCEIAEGAFIGSNAAIHPGKKVGKSSSVGACSYLIRSLADGCSAVGVPAKIIGRSSE